MRDSRPVHIENVFKSSPAYEAGICNGDMIIQVNGQSVKRLSKNEVYKLIERSGSSVKLKLIAGNSAIKRFDDKYSSKTFSSHKKARELFQQVAINQMLISTISFIFNRCWQVSSLEFRHAENMITALFAKSWPISHLISDNIQNYK